MKAASLQEIKQELSSLPHKELVNLCLKLIKSKKENKELLTYVLFESHDENGFVDSVRQEIDLGFAGLPRTGNYLIKKGLRKMLRQIAKYGRYTGSKQAELEMLLHFCFLLKRSGVVVKSNFALNNIFNSQMKKINTLLEMLHEDLHYDYRRKIEQLVS